MNLWINGAAQRAVKLSLHPARISPQNWQLFCLWAYLSVTLLINLMGRAEIVLLEFN